MALSSTSFKKSEDNINWRGDKAKKAAMHRWVMRWKGEPKKCDNCGTEVERRYEWANRDHSYKRILEDYIRMCTSCHRKYDIANNGYVGGRIKKK